MWYNTTTHNGLSASTMARSFRYAPFPRLTTPHFFSPKNDAYFSIRTARTPYIAGTLISKVKIFSFRPPEVFVVHNDIDRRKE
jgi:hypothetical protein